MQKRPKAPLLSTVYQRVVSSRYPTRFVLQSTQSRGSASVYLGPLFTYRIVSMGKPSQISRYGHKLQFRQLPKVAEKLTGVQKFDQRPRCRREMFGAASETDTRAASIVAKIGRLCKRPL